jgi:hypothetical protein
MLDEFESLLLSRTRRRGLFSFEREDGRAVSYYRGLRMVSL